MNEIAYIHDTEAGGEDFEVQAAWAGFLEQVHCGSDDGLLITLFKSFLLGLDLALSKSNLEESEENVINFAKRWREMQHTKFTHDLEFWVAGQPGKVGYVNFFIRKIFVNGLPTCKLEPGAFSDGYVPPKYFKGGLQVVNIADKIRSVFPSDLAYHLDTGTFELTDIAL